MKPDQDQVNTGDTTVSRCIVDAAIANLERVERLMRPPVPITQRL